MGIFRSINYLNPLLVFVNHLIVQVFLVSSNTGYYKLDVELSQVLFVAGYEKGSQPNVVEDVLRLSLYGFVIRSRLTFLGSAMYSTVYNWSIDE